LALLAPDGPRHVGSVGWLVPTAQYFIDLKSVAALIFMAWPTARPHAATPALARVLDREADRRHRLFRVLRDSPGAKTTAYTTPPEDALVTGAVLEMADRLLSTRDEEEAATYLEPLAKAAIGVHPPISYPLRRPAGSSFPLQVILLAHRRRLKGSRTEIIRRHSGLTRVQVTGH
jgi:hypothetical protein